MRAAEVLRPGCYAAMIFAACSGSDVVTPEPMPPPARYVLRALADTVLPDQVVGTVATVVPVVRLSFEDGRPAEGVTVVFDLSDDGTATLRSVSTDADGRASPGSWRLGGRAGEQTLTARAAGRHVTFRAHARPGPVARLTAVSGDRQRALAGAALRQRLRVHATDAWGNDVPGIAVTFEVVSGGGVMTPDNSATDDAGIAVSGSWTLGLEPGQQRARARIDSMELLFEALACDDAAQCALLVYVNLSPRGIVVRDEHSGIATIIASVEEVLHPRVSPDGSRIAFRRGSSLWIVNTDGTGARPIANGIGSAPTWSPDGDTIAYAGPFCLYDCTVHLISLTAGYVKSIAGMAADPAWSPDGRRMAFVALSGDDGYHSLHLMNTDGSGIVEVTPIDEGGIFGLAWSRDGARIAFTKCIAGSCDIYTVRPDGTEFTRLTTVGGVTFPTWWHDGTRVAFTRHTSSTSYAVEWVPSTGGQPTRLLSQAAYPWWWP